MYRSVVLAIPRNKTCKNYPQYSFFPYGPLKLLSYAKKCLPQVSFHLVDAGLYSDDETFLSAILSFHPDLVGISTHTSFAYKECLALNKKLLKRGISTIFGGIHVSTVPHQAVANRNIEIIQGQAFDGFVAYIRQDKKETIPNLVWKKNSSVIENPSAPWRRFDQLPPLNIDIIDIERYWQKFRNFHIGTPPFDEKCYTIFTHEGCLWRDRSRGGCEFCTPSTRTYFPNPHYVWREIANVISKFGPKFLIKDYGDSLSGNWNYVKALVQTKPSQLKPYEDYVFEVYLRSSEVNEQWQIDLLKTLGVLRVYIGYESFSNKILRNIRKGATVESHWRATKLLLSGGFYLLASFVLGCSSEDKTTIKETIEGCYKLKEMCGKKLLFLQASPIAVLPGSRAFNKLTTFEPQYLYEDLIDSEETRRRWYKHFTNFDSIKEAEKIIRETALTLGNLCIFKAIRGYR